MLIAWSVISYTLFTHAGCMYAHLCILLYCCVHVLLCRSIPLKTPDCACFGYYNNMQPYLISLYIGMCSYMQCTTSTLLPHSVGRSLVHASCSHRIGFSSHSIHERAVMRADSHTYMHVHTLCNGPEQYCINLLEAYCLFSMTVLQSEKPSS